MGLLACLMISCSEAPEPSQPAEIKGFIFFDLGANSHYSKAIRNRLGEKLGSDAISQQNVIDLTINAGVFLKKHFPELYQLNQALNQPEGQRVEHNTTQLMYRYARNKNTPFNYVALYFSNDTGKPLFFKIIAGQDAADTLETLKKKYGPPHTYIWQGEEGQTFFWRKDKDLFIVNAAKDRRGNPEYAFYIYYVANMEEMLSIEKARKKSEQEKIREAGESAF